MQRAGGNASWIMFVACHKDGKWTLEDSALERDDANNSFHIIDIHYNSTPGLYELMSMKDLKDDVYTEGDLITYKNILTATNAHRRNNM